MEVIGFVVDTKPYACWDWELKRKNIEFLEGIDSDYFEYVARININNIEGSDKQKAAMALRLSYSQALETLFALLCSVVQAPQCPIGWLLSYQNFQLKNVVKNISKQAPVLTKLKEPPITWEKLSACIHSNLGYEKEKIKWIQEGFAKAWRKFANDFINENFIDEYNGIKHGLRAKPGGFHLAVGPEKTPGVPAPPAKMVSLGGSAFGSTYFVKEHVVPNNKMNFRPRRHSHNWNPHNFAHGLILISMSIQNIISWLRVVNDSQTRKCRFNIPTSKNIFEKPWEQSVGVTHTTFDLIIEEGHLNPFSKEDILEIYEQ